MLMWYRSSIPSLGSVGNHVFRCTKLVGGHGGLAGEEEERPGDEDMCQKPKS